MPTQLAGEVGDELLGELHVHVVVAVGLVQLEHRELGVVPRREPLVPEHPADLVDLLEAADDEALEVELRRDPQVQVDVERVVVGDERAGRRPAGDRVQDRRLDLEVAAVLEEAAGERDQPAAQPEGGPGLLGDPQVDVALAVAGVGVGEAVPLVGELAPGLGQQHPLLDADRQLAGPGGHHLPRDAHPVTQRERAVALVVGGDRGPGEELDLAGAVLQRVEGRLALAPAPHDAPGDRRLRPGLGAGLEAGVLLGQPGRRRVRLVAVRDAWTLGWGEEVSSIGLSARRCARR